MLIEGIHGTRIYWIFLSIRDGFHLTLTFNTVYCFKMILVPYMSFGIGIYYGFMKRKPHFIICQYHSPAGPVPIFSMNFSFRVLNLVNCADYHAGSSPFSMASRFSSTAPMDSSII